MHRRVFLAPAVVVSLVAGIAVAQPAAAAPKWSLSPNPNPAGSIFTNLTGVACPRANSCFAVGYTTTTARTAGLVKHWNGSGWEIMRSLEPKGSRFTTWSAVSCPTAKSCFAVGSYTIAHRPRSLIEHWNGSNWAIMHVLDPDHSTSTLLSGVSCPATKSCFAVGSYTAAARTRTLVAHWNGSFWGITTAPNPNHSTSTVLSGVSCPSTRSCFAVGSVTLGPSAGSLVEHWNGSNWGIMRVFNPEHATSTVLTGVSCPSTKSCFAVGNYYPNNSLLIEHWNGSQWGIMVGIHPTGSTATVLSRVSCPSTKSCFAVGNERSGAFYKPLIEHWDGKQWGVLTSPEPSGATVAILNAVSCPTPSNCAAVGYYQNPNVKTLAERYA